MQELKAADAYRAQLRIRCHDVYQEAGTLSGGNQQKVVLSKWLFSSPTVLILDEPTRGIDVGAKYEIYQIINALAESGKAVVVISSEMPELLGMCDRICVMNEGRFVAEFARDEASQEAIMRAIMGSVRASEQTRSRRSGHERNHRPRRRRAGARRLRQGESAAIRDAAFAARHHGVLRVRHRRHPAAAAEPDQPRAAEQLHRHHGARHAAGDRDRAYRPLGRLRVRLRRRARGGHDGPARRSRSFRRRSSACWPAG